ncbi:TrmH family RNA methyltransferase [Fodinibius halophilus]|uniref:RNA methyltransferase n=1 Tax=Fodinibius halophilus TaxID=1736908 RepID=A0A6M1TAY3_9BACT|nr:RNA methyltransferase [Fodinibius halophilus]NGP89593.1 RNA methyltransferase [Fodinibius halophilus]
MIPRPVSNRQATLLRKLNKKKYRTKEQLFLIEGARAVEQVLANSSVSVQHLFFDESQQYWNQQQWQEALAKVEGAVLDEELFAEVSDTDNPQGVLAMCRMPAEISQEKLVEGGGIIIALDAVQDPGNLGTIIRTASWFGARGIISGKGTVDLFHPKVVRATAGATCSIPYKNGPLSPALDELETQGWSIYLLDAGPGAIPLKEVSSLGKSVIVVGNEAHGVRPELITGDRQTVKIPSVGENRKVESLNAAIATSIALYALT